MCRMNFSFTHCLEAQLLIGPGSRPPFTDPALSVSTSIRRDGTVQPVTALPFADTPFTSSVLQKFPNVGLLSVRVPFASDRSAFNLSK
jgi:hypothetical protein